MTAKKSRQKMTVKPSASGERIDLISRFEDDQPFLTLGPHHFPVNNRVIINAFLPRATEAWVKPLNGKQKKQPMKKIHPTGLFQAIYDDQDKIFSYHIESIDSAGYRTEFDDPYAHLTDISDYDLYLMGEGNHFKSYEKLGARIRTFNGVSGVHFAVWAPNAKSVSVIGNFNHWFHGAHPMTRLQWGGIWALFIPGLKSGEVYKYAVRSWADGRVLEKSDPYAFQAEMRPSSASIVSSGKTYLWHDSEWIKIRKQTDMLTKPISIYEVHLGSWKRDEKKDWGFLNYRELAHQLVEYVKWMGYTHIELMPIMEHPLDISWGYQVINYYAPTSRFGSPEDFKYFMDYCHQNEIGVILDWVPAHFPKDDHGLANFDGKQIYAYDNWKKGEHKEWGTFVFDYGRNEVRNFLISNALFWLDEYHVDGIRIDAVASMLYLDYSRPEGEWEPNQYGGRDNPEAVHFIKKLNEVVHHHHPGVITIAEESTAWPAVSRPTYMNGLGFSMKWNMGWMHDMLDYFSKEPVHRKYHQNMLTFSMLYAFTENFILPISHDEVVHGKRSLLEKMSGDDWQKFANTRLFLTYMYAHPGKKLLFMGSDFGQRAEWDSSRSIDWHFLNYEPHRQLNQCVRDLNRIYKNYRAFYEVDFDWQGFEWIDFSDADAGLISFIRWSRDRKQLLLFAFNMTPVPRQEYRIGTPKQGFYEEILNSDAKEYGGAGIGNAGGLHADNIPWHNRSHSININLPPLGAIVFCLNEK